MYISDPNELSVNFDELNRNGNGITWSRGPINEDAIHINFEIEGDIVHRFDSQLKQLEDEIKDASGYLLTGMKYDIRQNSGLFVFSDISFLDADKAVSRDLKGQDQVMTIPRVIAQEETVYCSGVFASIYDWDYDVNQITVVPDEGVYIEAVSIHH